MPNDARWIAARRVLDGDWQDLHTAPVARESSMKLVEKIRSSETPDGNSNRLRWSEDRNGSWTARDPSYEYLIATIDMWPKLASLSGPPTE